MISRSGRHGRRDNWARRVLHQHVEREGVALVTVEEVKDVRRKPVAIVGCARGARRIVRPVFESFHQLFPLGGSCVTTGALAVYAFPRDWVFLVAKPVAGPVFSNLLIAR